MATDIAAIGDSIFNGTRSLTTSAELAALSAPKLIAEAMNKRMAVPDYPLPVLLDLENELRRADKWLNAKLKSESTSRKDVSDLASTYGLAEEIYASIKRNARTWWPKGKPTNTGWNSAGGFENLAIAQSTVQQAHRVRPGLARRAIPALVEQVESYSSFNAQSIAAITQLYFAINTAFVLNPQADPALDNDTQVTRLIPAFADCDSLSVKWGIPKPVKV